MAARAATVIAGVSLVTTELDNGECFDLALSPDGIEIRRPGQAARQLSWDHVTDWEMQDQPGGVLLTLRGRGAVTPLLVPHWTVDELKAVLRDATTGAAAPAHAETPTMAAPTAVAAEPAPPAASQVSPEPEPPPESESEPAQTRAPDQRRKRQWLKQWKRVVTVTLLALVATAVTLVLLQSAGIIHISFLGPTA